ncbi:MAG: PmoA family protein [Planctomycetes bacterium]|nr:PmoA family protein [Planctomycetota bacterium]
MSPLILKVDAGRHARIHCPVSTVLKPEGLGQTQHLRLSVAGASTPCQVVPNGQEVRLTWLLRHLEEGKKKRYALRSERGSKAAGNGVELLDQPGERVSVFLNGKLLTHYYYGTAYPRPFLHPLIGPYGNTVTRDFPMPGGPESERRDHKHHRSVWTAWGDLNGVDDWSEESGHGRVVHRRFAELGQGPVLGRVVAENDWVSREGRKVCEEVREMIFYNVPASSRVIDYNVTFVAMQGPLRFGDTKEGGILSVRVATSMDVTSGGRIQNSFAGLNEPETWGKPSHWCDYSGLVDGKKVGIAVFDHPSNFRHPTTWHVRNYGLMTANPFGLSHFTGNKSRDGSHELPAGGQLVFRYRLFVHKGDAVEGGVAERYHDYVNPPAVSQEAGKA